MPTTAIVRFREDLQRGRALLDLSGRLPSTTAAEQALQADLRRSAWMLGVGALDAYFCDAYSDLVACTMIAQQRQALPAIALPDFFQEIRLPVKAILSQYSQRHNWRWRMAARGLMSRDNVLKLSKIENLFNPFFKVARAPSFFHNDLLTDWMVRPDARTRLFGMPARRFAALVAAGNSLGPALHQGRQQLEERFKLIFQRRHDCIHACDHPKSLPQNLERDGTVLKVLEDVAFLVENSDAHLTAGFRQFLATIGCVPTTISSVGY